MTHKIIDGLSDAIEHAKFPMTHDAETVERVARAAAFSIRQPNDVSSDAEEYWKHTDEAARHTWRIAIAEALSALPPQEVSVKDAAKVLLTPDSLGRRSSIYDACEGVCKVHRFDKVLRAISEGE